MSRTKLLAATAAALALPLTACGGDSTSSDEPTKDATPAFAKKSGKEIFSAATEAMREAGPVRVSGSIVDDGKPIEFDVRTRGSDECTGTVGQDGGTATFVVSGNATYLKGDEGFWKATVGEEAEQAMDFFGDRWVKAPSEDEFTQLCDLSQLLDLASAESDDAVKDIEVGEVSELDGEQVVEITSVEGDDEFAVFIETAEPHRMLKLESKNPDDPGSIAFDFDAEVEVVEPAEDEVVEIPAS